MIFLVFTLLPEKLKYMIRINSETARILKWLQFWKVLECLKKFVRKWYRYMHMKKVKIVEENFLLANNALSAVFLWNCQIEKTSDTHLLFCSLTWEIICCIYYRTRIHSWRGTYFLEKKIIRNFEKKHESKHTILNMWRKFEFQP